MVVPIGLAVQLHSEVWVVKNMEDYEHEEDKSNSGKYYKLSCTITQKFGNHAV